MRLSKILILALATACAAKMLPVRAADEAEDAFHRVDPSRVIGQVLNEELVSLLFGYVRESFAARIEGRMQKPPPEALSKRMDEAGRALQTEGIATVLTMLDEFECVLRGALREEFQDGSNQARGAASGPY